MQYFAIIVAGGSGKRMVNSIPKQFLLLNGKPILYHSLKAFQASKFNPKIIVVIDHAYKKMWEDLCLEHSITIEHTLVNGGSERFYSVKNGLDLIDTNGIVAIHDAVRPLTTTLLIDTIYEAAEKNGNAIAAICPSESIRYKNKVVNRNEVLLVQTPQTFDVALLKKAYNKPFEDKFTDDASVAEAEGVVINIIPGERCNIKITWPEDLTFAETYLK